MRQRRMGMGGWVTKKRYRDEDSLREEEERRG